MQKTIKRILFTLYIAVLVCMGVATIVEKYHGTDFVDTAIYGAWWFSLLWGLLAAVAIFYFVKKKVKTPSTVALHLSFIIILAGALLTHVSSKRGMIHLRMNEPSDTYMTSDGNNGMKEEKLPFKIELNSFSVKYHDGTSAESDYKSKLTIIDGDKKEDGEVSMNNIFTYKSYRLYQSSYDEDMDGSVLSINSDPYGIPVTYTGYGLLFLSLVWMLFDPKGAYRSLFRSPLMKRGLLIAMLFLSFGHNARAVSVLPKETAEKFGELNILYNNRICPLQTFAIDFTKKIYGSASYNGYTPEQVLTGWIFFGNEWSAEPFIKVKGGELKTTLGLPDYCSINAFFRQDMGGYILGPYIQEYYNGGQQDAFHKQAADIDQKVTLIMDLRRGLSLKIFPYTFKKSYARTPTDPAIVAGTTTWYSPADRLPSAIDSQHRLYMQNVFSLINENVMISDYGRVNDVVDKMIKYQGINGGTSLPSSSQVWAERAYNKVPFATILSMVNLTLGFITLFFYIYRITRRGSAKPVKENVLSVMTWLPLTIMLISFLALTFCEVLRWIVSRTIPMANGYETMLFVAWLVMLLSLITYRRFKIVLSFGFIMSGFFLLVSHISQMDPAIGQVMPVLNSPLLSVHVSIIMTGFALLSITFICGVVGLLTGRHGNEDVPAQMQLLSRLFLYPALTALGIGIFMGAIWANISWGQYWGWDPKEVWALITFMVYAIVVHRQTISSLQRPKVYHAFVTLAFLTILMTYFGVNYFLGGMHSYA